MNERIRRDFPSLPLDCTKEIEALKGREQEITRTEAKWIDVKEEEVIDPAQDLTLALVLEIGIGMGTGIGVGIGKEIGKGKGKGKDEKEKEKEKGVIEIEDNEKESGTQLEIDMVIEINAIIMTQAVVTHRKLVEKVT